MIVILKMRGKPSEPLVYGINHIPEIAPEILGWLIATDVHDARRKADAAGESHLASALYSMEFPRAGRHEISSGYIGEHRYIMLVD